MEFQVLKEYEDVHQYVTSVTSIADQNKGSFGFLPASVYMEMAIKGQLWVVIDSIAKLKGYLMFGGKMPTLKVFQIYVDELARGKGVGRLLIGSLKDHAKKHHYHTIAARVASDLPANKFWELEGFPIFRQVKGGETTKRTINHRCYSLAVNDLFGGLIEVKGSVVPSSPVLDQPVYALDLNLIFDLSKGRPGYQQVSKLIQRGFSGDLTLCITPEIKRELARHSFNAKGDLAIRLAGSFPEISSVGDVSQVLNSLRTIVFPDREKKRKDAENDISDLRHLAYCIFSKVDGFVTREKALLRACNGIKEKYGFSILSPDELIIEDNEDLSSLVPNNADFSFKLTGVTAEIKSFLGEFTMPEVVVETVFSSSSIKESRTVFEARYDGKLFGVYCFERPIKSSRSAFSALVVDEDCPKAVAAIDHFLEMSLREKNAFSFRLDLYVSVGQDLTEITLRKKGFFRLGDHFVKFVSNVFLDAKSWVRFSSDFKELCGFTLPQKLPSLKELTNTGICITDASDNMQAFNWFDFETVISPKFILNDSRNCILVPIKENFASGLVGDVKNQLSLLESHDQTLLLEKAYFRSTNKSSLFQRGGIIAFYISGSKSIQEIIGFARITFTEIMTVVEAILKVKRQGVLSNQELEALANGDGCIHVFTFDNFLEFDNRITFGKARDLGLISGANLVAPEKINVKKLRILIKEAFND